MKKEYLVGGILGIVLCGIVAYAVMTFIGIQKSDTSRQLVQQLPALVPLDGTVPETRQPAQDQGKSESGISRSDSSDRKEKDEPKTEGGKGVMITLKNGKVLIADACREFGSQLRCDMPNGEVAIEQQDIESTKEIKIVKRFAAEPQPTTGIPPGTDKKDESGKTATNAKVPTQPGNGRLSGSLTPEQIKRLDQIAERKTILQPERERLMKERQQLHEDVSRMGAIRSQEQYDSLKKKISDLETTITNFNDEVKKLNEEEKTILTPSSP
jgi:hypothetical protein